MNLRQFYIRGLRPLPLGLNLLRYERILRSPLQYLRRNRLAASIGRSNAIRIDHSLGYHYFHAPDLPLGNATLESAREIYQRTRHHVARIHAAQPERYGIVFDLLSDDRLLAWPIFVDFALSSTLLETAIDYLGTVPVLRRTALALSRYRPDLSQPQGSQLFHFDREDQTQLKLYLLVESVGPNQGPLKFLSAEASTRVLRALRKEGGSFSQRRGRLEFRDEEVLRHCEPDEIHSLEGPPGTGVMLDTSRCLHYGSRMMPNTERLLIYLIYQRFEHYDATPNNSFDLGRHAPDLLRTLVLTPPRRKPIGWYCPNPILSPGPAARGRSGVQLPGRWL